MFCFKHTDRTAVSPCSSCGRFVCAECCVEIDGRVYCKDCLAEIIASRSSGSMRAGSAPGIGDDQCFAAHHPHGAYPPAGHPFPGHPHHRHPRACASRSGRCYSGFLLFITSCILPGMGYMYLGLMKRGLFFLASFFLSVFIISEWNVHYLALVFPVLWITTIFDGFKKLRELRNGDVINDNVDDIMVFVRNNKKIICIFVGIFLFSWIINVAASLLAWTLPINPYTARKIAPILLIAGGLFLLFKKKKVGGHVHDTGLDRDDQFEDNNI